MLLANGNKCIQITSPRGSLNDSPPVVITTVFVTLLLTEPREFEKQCHRDNGWVLTEPCEKENSKPLTLTNCRYQHIEIFDTGQTLMMRPSLGTFNGPR